MNVNRQNNCYSGRSGRPNVILPPTGCNVTTVPVSSCCNAVPTPAVSCCNAASVSEASCCNAASVPVTSCCNNATVPASACCNDGNIGAIIIGGGAEPACNKETTLRDCPIAMAYVPWQDYGNIYAQPQALKNGTIFRELDLDFAGRRCN